MSQTDIKYKYNVALSCSGPQADNLLRGEAHQKVEVNIQVLPPKPDNIRRLGAEKTEETEEDEDTAPEDLAPLLGKVFGALDAVQHPGHGAPGPHVLTYSTVQYSTVQYSTVHTWFTMSSHEAAHLSSHRVLEILI